jgi:hypothetical protein
MNIQDNKIVQRLLNKQHEICYNILTELKQHGQKKLIGRGTFFQLINQVYQIHYKHILLKILQKYY